MPLDMIADFTPKTEDPEWYWLHTFLGDWMGPGLTYWRDVKKFVATDKPRKAAPQDVMVEISGILSPFIAMMFLMMSRKRKNGGRMGSRATMKNAQVNIRPTASATHVL
jgi:hypothetical protein